jgi:trk system potassium uptake protein TrkA
MGVPLPDESFAPGDRVAVLADFDVLSDVRRLLVGEELAAAPGGE